ncbi:hypothetical protein M0813_10334 [Anaeramoeba flamelloides]|uniref:Adenosine kinase n=1 Tax=Anaeramoeba flamelloides TaxID=1746091 RepID=A0ABQ8X318_9EUKA|nr:hypothetical protein M0813_10334 [Anaeramoeba flamelloides]
MFSLTKIAQSPKKFSSNLISLRSFSRFVYKKRSKCEIFGIGNPLLDMVAKVDQAFLEKYNLPSGDNLIGNENDYPLFVELHQKYDVSFVAGGATQNAIRVAQWLLQKPGITAYAGSVGDDEFGKILKKTVTKDGVDAYYTVDPTRPSGTCAVMSVGTVRTLIACLGAAYSFDPKHLVLPEIKKKIDEASIFYISGFVINESFPACLEMAKTAVKDNKLFAMNIAAAYLCSKPHLNKFKQLMPYWDLIVGNESEVVSLGKGLGWLNKNTKKENVSQGLMEDLIKELYKSKKINTKMPRIVAVTQSTRPTLLYAPEYDINKVTSYPVKKCPSHQFVDSNGAGDGFVAGFLSQFLNYKLKKVEPNLANCIKAAHWSAGYIIRQRGCTIKGKPKYQLD